MYIHIQLYITNVLLNITLILTIVRNVKRICHQQLKNH